MVGAKGRVEKGLSGSDDLRDVYVFINFPVELESS
jgi:hypothetical protein